MKGLRIDSDFVFTFIDFNIHTIETVLAISSGNVNEALSARAKQFETHDLKLVTRSFS